MKTSKETIDAVVAYAIKCGLSKSYGNHVYLMALSGVSWQCADESRPLDWDDVYTEAKRAINHKAFPNKGYTGQ